MKKFLIGAVATGLVFGGAAQAGDIALKIDARDLNSPAQAEKVYTVLQKRAWQACAPTHVSISATQRSRTCQRKLMAEFVAQLDTPYITALHGKRRHTRFAEAK